MKLNLHSQVQTIVWGMQTIIIQTCINQQKYQWLEQLAIMSPAQTINNLENEAPRFQHWTRMVTIAC